MAFTVALTSVFCHDHDLVVLAFILLMTTTLIVQPAGGQILFDIQEEQVPPVLIGNVGKAANIGDRPNLEFSIIGKINYQRDLFRLDSLSGDLTTTVILDREDLCGPVSRCEMVTLVAASSPPNFLTRFNVNVTIVDANDQSPEFRETDFTIAMSERSQVNATFQLPVAFDTDVVSMFKVRGYRLKPEFQTLFDLVPQKQTTPVSVEPAVQLRLRGRLDRETTPTYNLTLVAYDGGSPPHTAELPIQIIVLDENDNAPEFSSLPYSISVKEVQEVGVPVFAVVAEDKDEAEKGRVGYEFSLDVDRRIQEFFEIGEESGNIKLIKSLIKEGGKTFVFKVKAFDHGSPSKFSEAEVSIAIEDTINDPPNIRVSPWKSKGDSAVVSEGAVIGTKVAFVDVEDTDSDVNGATTCDADSDFFILQPYEKVGVYTISVGKRLDRETDASHRLIIRCSDMGTPPQTSTANLSIVVEDVNDNPPVFGRKTYRMQVRENQEAGKWVGIVSASDKDENENAKVRYVLEKGVSKFEINVDSGVITTAVKNLDREKVPIYSFKVYAVNDGSEPLTGTTSVVVNIEDVNDVWPHFDNASYRFTVSEATPVNHVIGKVHANDPDLDLGGIVEYLKVHSPLTLDPPFSVSREDGSITLTEPLDHERGTSYKFVVTAVDLGRPPRNSSVEVIIVVLDENDNSPVIAFPNPDNLSVTLNLDVSPGHEVVKVIAHDSDAGDNGRLTFYLNSRDGNATSRLFWINEDTGLITLKAPLTLADVRKYELVISVYDNGAEQRATRAVLQVEVVRSLNPRGSSSDSNMTIVIIMVCVTLFVAIIVLATLCFIRHLDRKKFEEDNSKRSQKKIHHYPASSNSSSSHYKGSYTSADQAGCDVYFDTSGEVTPALQKQPMTSSSASSTNNTTTRRSPTNHKVGGKKSVTFDEDPAHGSIASEVTNPLNDSVFMEAGSMSTFKPSPPPLLYTQNGKLIGIPSTSAESPVSPMHALSNASRNASGSPSPFLTHPNPRDSPRHHQLFGGESKEDSVINNALQQHNALVRSVRGDRHRPTHSNRQGASAVNRDTDLSSSSSVETSDSGHGSELDVSVVKVNV